MGRARETPSKADRIWHCRPQSSYGSRLFKDERCHGTPDIAGRRRTFAASTSFWPLIGIFAFKGVAAHLLKVVPDAQKRGVVVGFVRILPAKATSKGHRDVYFERLSGPSTQLTPLRSPYRCHFSAPRFQDILSKRCRLHAARRKKILSRLQRHCP
jgi:hypothetical protein